MLAPPRRVDIGSTVIRPYRPAEDSVWFHKLWHKVLDPRWALQPQQIQRSVTSATMVFVAEHHGVPAGLCAVVHQPSGPAGLLAILVEPSRQRRGVGMSLLAKMETLLRKDGCSALTLGFGAGGDYFWPGVPTLESAAWPFFAKYGWCESDRSSDLVQELRNFRAPASVTQCLRDQGIALQLASPLLRDRILEFEQRCFPAWSPFFENALRRSDYGKILVACDGEGSVLGSVLLDHGSPLTWRQHLGDACGALSVLGVQEEIQKRGIGMALASRAMELLRDRGCSRCYIHWTGLTDWYGKLGATIWAEYRMGSKRISSIPGAA